MSLTPRIQTQKSKNIKQAKLKGEDYYPIHIFHFTKKLTHFLK